MKRVIAIVLMVMAATTASGFAVASMIRSSKPDDQAATHVLVQATHVFNQKLVSILPTVGVAVHRRVQQVDRECPSIMVGVPNKGAFGPLNYEVLLAPVVTIVDVQGLAMRTYMRSIARLKWSSTLLTHVVRTSVAELQAELKVLPPNPCADIRAWIRSGYRQLPTSTARFIREFPLPTKEFPEGGPGRYVRMRRLLGPYEDAKDRDAVRKTEHLEAYLSKALQQMRVRAATELTHTLRLDPNVQQTFIGLG
jgi:hypothetical protein